MLSMFKVQDSIPRTDNEQTHTLSNILTRSHTLTNTNIPPSIHTVFHFLVALGAKVYLILTVDELGTAL